MYVIKFLYLKSFIKKKIVNQNISFKILLNQAYHSKIKIAKWLKSESQAKKT